MNQASEQPTSDAPRLHDILTASAREKFAHNDTDLDTRFRARVKDLVKLAIREARGGQDL